MGKISFVHQRNRGLILSLAGFVVLLTILYASERMWPRCFTEPIDKAAPVRENVENEDPNARWVYRRANKPIPKCATKKDDKGRIIPAKSFLMVFQSRSGSTTISQTMQQHSQIKHEFEYLDREKVPPEDSETSLNMTREFFKKTIAGGLIPGYKIRAHHVLADVEGWQQLVREYDTRVIWQYRKNVFKVSVGTYARLVLGDNLKAGGINIKHTENSTQCELGVGCSFRITDWAEFHRMLTGRIAYDLDMMNAARSLDGGRECIFELTYEDFLYHREESIADLWKFMGLKPINYDTYLVKATGDNLCEVIENYDEMCTMFYGCPIWQPHLEDFHNDCRCRNFSYGSGDYCSMYNDRQIAQMSRTA